MYVVGSECLNSLFVTNRARYCNNAVVDNKIEATASTKGTTITVEDLFYNIPMRQRVYNQSVGEETKYILLLLQVFSMHYSSQGILFSLKEVSFSAMNRIMNSLQTKCFSNRSNLLPSSTVL